MIVNSRGNGLFGLIEDALSAYGRGRLLSQLQLKHILTQEQVN